MATSAPELRAAVFGSGEGTTVEALVAAIREGHVPVRIAGVLVDRPEAPLIARANRLGLEVQLLPSRGHDPSDWSAAATWWLDSLGAELVVLAGFRAILPRSFLDRWRGRVLNVHPSLLPEFGGAGMYGRRVHEAVLRDGREETGATVHIVTELVDGGPVLAQGRLPVDPGETPESLRERLRPVEVGLLVEVLRRFGDRRWTLPYEPDRPGAPRPLLS
jgi:phosphoribosylglycinamide formyltransferase-1